MSMSVGPATGENEVMVEMNTTPLIDVMLVLLVMLIITLPIQTHAVKLDMPVSAPPVNQIIKVEKVELGVDFDGTITWNGNAVDRTTLKAYLHNASLADPQPEIHLNPNKLAKYDIVAKILADAQSLNVKKIGFTGLDQYRQ